VTAARVKVCFPLLVVACHHGGDQDVPVFSAQPGQGRVAQPGQAGTGLVEGIRGAGGLVVWLRMEAVVPVAVPVVAGQG
jgi:hypothetical protein